MRELTIEQKAKAYDKAIERAKSLLSGNQLGNAWIYKLPLELAETEDEKIRKDIINYLALYKDAIGEEYESWIAWLEKQSKQNLTKA